MVDSVFPTAGRSRIQRLSDGQNAPKIELPLTGAARGASSVGGETVSLSTAAQTMPSELQAGPPFDFDTVKRIKDAISEGKYPIDLEKITQSLFDSFFENMV